MAILKRKCFRNADGVAYSEGHVITLNGRKWPIVRMILPGTNERHPDGRVYLRDVHSDNVIVPHDPSELGLEWK